MSSSWDKNKERSKYHFNPELMHPLYDTVDRVGHIDLSRVPATDLQKVIEESYGATWRTRGNKDKHGKIGVRSRKEEEFQAEEYDLENTGYEADHVISNLNWNIPDSIQTIADEFKLERQMTRVHVQFPGQVWNLHMDKLEKWAPDNPDSVERYMVQLTDWNPGQWFSYGNYTFEHWKAGDVTTFNWQDVPHSTANAGHHPRVTLQVTGISSAESRKYLNSVRESTIIGYRR
jgi:hypothetical protein|tara:strand:- start:1599 stop:2294 length:696 start_codon:yes stop_codon:yes gene_type:complete